MTWSLPARRQRSSREYTDAVALWNAFNEHRVTIVPDEPLEKGGKDDEKPEKITLRLGRMVSPLSRRQGWRTGGGGVGSVNCERRRSSNGALTAAGWLRNRTLIFPLNYLKADYEDWPMANTVSNADYVAAMRAV